MLKRILLLCIFVSSITAKAQFTIDDDTLYAYGYVAPTSLGYADIFEHTVLRHQGGAIETIKWIRTDNTLPDPAWESAICDIINCRAPEVDTGSFQIGGTDTGELSFHFYPKNIRGTGTMTIRFFRESNPLDYSEVVINCQAWKAASIGSISNEALTVYPNPVIDVIHINHPEIISGMIELIDISGRIVYSASVIEGQPIDISNLESGIYTIRLTGENGVAIKQFIKN
ncbi:MAG: T9SS type A sorting domain-containing protein [Bacteroidia bacterium]|nr:T9SS type A sorting domain-containing protein [Bacteroidia bacterium]